MFRAALDELPLEAVLELAFKSKLSGLFVVEAGAVSGEVLLEKGDLYDARTRSPGKLSGYRALDYLLGIREGEVHLATEGLSRPPTLATGLMSYAFVRERSEVWNRAYEKGFPQAWSLTLLRKKPLGPLDPAIAQGEGRPIAEAFFAWKAYPSVAAVLLASLAKEGFLRFAPKEERKARFRFPFFGRRG